jgi:MtrB/PioB family decaheme-associated outer membrane protein
MTSSKPWLVLGTFGAIGALSAAGALAADVDTSQWKCGQCPVDSGLSGSVDAGAAAVSGASQRYGDYTGLNKKGGVLLLGGTLRYRGADGYYADVSASDLGTDARSLAAVSGREGRYVLRLGYDETPRYFADGAQTPFLGAGSAVQTLPAGYPAGNTSAMPLAGTLQPVEIGYRRSRFDLGATWLAGTEWSLRAGLRHTTREGSQPLSLSFFSTATQLAAPVNQSTDELEVAARYAGRQLQASLAWRLSKFRNDDASLTWSNPFTTGTLGGTTGRLALPPDNEFQQLQATVGYTPYAQVRLSADLAVGRMTQDAAFLSDTVNTSLANPVLPAASLQGRINTVNAAVRLSVTPITGVHLNASLARDERDNRTPTAAYPSVSTDLFAGPAYTNRPYGFVQDKLRLSADLRGPKGSKFSFGIDQDQTQRTLQEVNRNTETSYYTRLTVQPLSAATLSLKLAHAERTGSAYTPVPGIDPPENPLLRKFYMANRLRDSASGRADFAIGDNITLGVDFDFAADNYRDTTLGLTDGRAAGVGGDIAWAVSEDLHLTLFGRSDGMRTHQVGSQQGGVPDWNADTKDGSDFVGAGLRQALIKDRLDIGADFTYTRTRSDVMVNNGVAAPGFPTITTALDSVKLFATYKLSDKLALTGSYAYAHYHSQDWHLDGVGPATIPNVLTLGVQPPAYNISVVRLSLRYQF